MNEEEAKKETNGNERKAGSLSLVQGFPELTLEAWNIYVYMLEHDGSLPEGEDLQLILEDVSEEDKEKHLNLAKYKYQIVLEKERKALEREKEALERAKEARKIALEKRKKIAALYHRYLSGGSQNVDSGKEDYSYPPPPMMIFLFGSFTKLNIWGSKKHITFPDDIKIIKKWSFSSCRNLRSIIIQEGVEEIEECAFNYNENLEFVVIPSSVRKIGRWAFSGCKSLKTIIFPEDGSIEICEEAFKLCENLEYLLISGGVSKINKNAFRLCKKLKLVVFSSEYYTIHRNIFTVNNCPNFVIMSDNILSEIRELLFDCPSLKFLNDLKSFRDIKKCLLSMRRNRNSKDAIKKLLSLNFKKFLDCDNYKAANIPNYVATIGDGDLWEHKCYESVAYYNKWDLAERIFFWVKDFKIEDSMLIKNTKIDNWEEVDVPDRNIEKIGGYQNHYHTENREEKARRLNLERRMASKEIRVMRSFDENGQEIRKYILPRTRIVEKGLFLDVKFKYNSIIEMPNCVEEIDSLAFWRCRNLKTIILSKNLKSISDLHKSSIEYIEIPDGIGQIQRGAFSECSSLRSIVIPSSVYCIGKYAFEECYKLESVIMKCDHLTIGTEAFASCTNLRKVVMFDSVDIENFAFKKCYNIKSFIRIRNGKPQGTVEKYGCPINCKETFVETKSISEDFWNNI